MTCNDCIHHDLCFDNGTLFIHYAKGKKIADAENGCPFKAFKNKADFVEVKHGYWKEYFSAGKFHYDCSVCDDGFATKERLKTVPNYCSNCGAKMDGGELSEFPTGSERKNYNEK